MKRTRILASALAALALACGTPVDLALQRADGMMEEGQIDSAVTALEKLRDEYPKRADVRVALGVAYYRKARSALEEKREKDYLTQLEQAEQQFVEAVELDPEDSKPHTWMGIVAVYKNDSRRALRDFRNALRLDPRDPVHHTNLAELHVYRGELGAARSHLEKARQKQAPPAMVELVETLAAWRQGDYVEARDLFDGLYALDADFVKQWNEAPIDDPIESFQDLTEFCCGHTACGPYMEKACAKTQHEVAKRTLSDEALLEELRIEQERGRKLRAIYQKRRELEVEVEPDAPEKPK